MDLKCGNGAFMSNFADAKALAQSIVTVANGAGCKTSAVLTDMNQVLGYSAGNAVEVREALSYLQNENVNPRLDIIIKTLCARLLCQCGRCASVDEAQKLVGNVLASGTALEKFAQMVAALGGPRDFCEKADAYLPQAAHTKPIFAPQAGYVTAMDTRAIGVSIIKLKGGRSVPDEKLDLATGYTEFVQIGDYVDEKTPLAMVHYQDEAQFIAAKQDIQQAITITNEKPALTSPILLTI
jgi:thymidine phosphorylase